LAGSTVDKTLGTFPAKDRKNLPGSLNGEVKTNNEFKVQRVIVSPDLKKEGIMKKFGILLLAALISMGLVAVMGGCGGGGGGESLPQSSPSYAGSNNPAVIDSTTALLFVEVPWSIDQILSELDLIGETGLSAVAETSVTLDGTASGTVTLWARLTETDTATKYTFKAEQKITFMNFEDDGSTFDSVLVGDGSVYMQIKEVETYSGPDWVT
jgi:hypothetical protein